MSDSRWRVVAVRRNGKAIVLDEYLSRERAEAFQQSLLSISAFPEVRIEPDIDAGPATPREPAPCSIVTIPGPIDAISAVRPAIIPS